MIRPLLLMFIYMYSLVKLFIIQAVRTDLYVLATRATARADAL